MDQVEIKEDSDASSVDDDLKVDAISAGRLDDKGSKFTKKSSKDK